jgi:hypothetical protein
MVSHTVSYIIYSIDVLKYLLLVQFMTFVEARAATTTTTAEPVNITER